MASIIFEWAELSLHSRRGTDCPPGRMARPAVLDSFSHFPHINIRLVHILCSRQVPARRPNQLAPEIVSISSEGLCLYCQHKNSLLGWLGRQREPRLPHGLGAEQATGLQLCIGCASAHSSENAYHKAWLSFFVRRTEHFHLPLRGVSHAEWPKDEHENTPTETGSVICCPLKAVVIERHPPRTGLSQRAKKLSAISGARPC